MEKERREIGMGSFSSGSTAVDALGKINISGNVIPHAWHKTILRDNGKPYLLAITLLADIVYWYRPVEIRDEASGHIIGWRKRFRGDHLQKTYEQYSEFYGESKRSIKAALDRLEELRVIKKIFRDITLSNGTKVANIMFIALNPERLKELTFIDDDGGTFGPSVQKSGEEEINNRGYKIPETPETAPIADSVGGGTKFCNTPYKEMYDYPRNSVIPVAEECTPLLQNFVGPPPEFCKTNTENTEEITNGEYQSIYLTAKGGDEDRPERGDQMDWMADRAERYRDLVYENTNYRWHMENDDIIDREEFTGLVELILDVVCADHNKPIFVNSSAMPPEVVKSRLLKLNDGHIRYVMDCLRKNPNTDGIESLRNYKLTCLYNAPVTMDTYYQQMVNHDMGNRKYESRDKAV